MHGQEIRLQPSSLNGVLLENKGRDRLVASLARLGWSTAAVREKRGQMKLVFRRPWMSLNVAINHNPVLVGFNALKHSLFALRRPTLRLTHCSMVHIPLVLDPDRPFFLT